MAMECFLGFLRSRRFFRPLSCEHVTYIRRFSKLLLLPSKDEAGEVHGDVLLAVHLKCSIFKPPHICHIITRSVSKEASGLQESNRAPHSQKISFLTFLIFLITPQGHLNLLLLLWSWGGSLSKAASVRQHQSGSLGDETDSVRRIIRQTQFPKWCSNEGTREYNLGSQWWSHTDAVS